MNRNNRTKIKNASEALYNSILQSASEYRQVLQAVLEDESSKLERLPEAFQGADKGENLRDGVALVEGALEGLEKIEAALEQLVADKLGYSLSYTPVARPEAGPSADLKRDMRFQALLPKELVEKLRFQSSMTGLSKNELLVRALDNYFL